MIHLDLLVEKTLNAEFGKQEQIIAEDTYPKDDAPADPAVFEIKPQIETAACEGDDTPHDLPGSFQIVRIDTPKFSSTTMQLAAHLTANFEELKDFIAELRRAIQMPDKRFKLDLTNCSEEHRRLIKNTAFLMMGLIILSPKKDPMTLQGRVIDVPSVTRFLMGGFLELGVCQWTAEIVSAFADARGFSWEVNSNVIVTTDGQSFNEVDVLIRIGETVIICETKSGMATHTIDYEKQYLLGKKLNVIPDRYIVLCTSITAQMAEQVHDFLGFHICNLSEYESVLRNILNSFCEEE